MPEWVLYGNFALNLLIIPLVKILWDIKVDLSKLQQKLCDHIDSDAERLDRLERAHDAR